MGSVLFGGEGLNISPPLYFSAPILPFFHERRLLTLVTFNSGHSGGGKVKHFDEAQWADFARNLTSAGERAAMQDHVNSGCVECASQLSLAQDLVLFAKTETGFIPSDDAMRIAKSNFWVAPKAAKSLVRLVFDSRLQPAMAGTRGTAAARQFLFETDKLYIDLRLDGQAERLSLVGQIVDRSQTKQAVQDLPIHLHKGKLQLAGTKTNEFGEFQFEFDASSDLSISIAVGPEDPIFLPLYGIHGKPLNPIGRA